MTDPARQWDLSVVVPVFNSEKSLALLMGRLHPVLKICARDFEAILVDDDSKDHSWAIIQQLSQQYPWVRGISLARNYGQHNALLCGIRAARQPIIVTLDDDLQNPPEEIPKLLEPLTEGWDVVYGAPARGRHGLPRDGASMLIKWSLQKTIRADVAWKVSPFRAFRRSIAEAFAEYQGPFLSLDVLLSWGTTRVTSVNVEHHHREHGQSNYTLFMLLSHAADLVVGSTTLPLRLTTILGICFSSLGLILLLYILIRYTLAHGSVPGFPFLASIVSIFSGVQLFCLGIIGEYMGRIYTRTMDKPVYMIRRTTSEPRDG